MEKKTKVIIGVIIIIFVIIGYIILSGDGATPVTQQFSGGGCGI
jgi:hypothetical protein